MISNCRLTDDQWRRIRHHFPSQARACARRGCPRRRATTARAEPTMIEKTKSGSRVGIALVGAFATIAGIGEIIVGLTGNYLGILTHCIPPATSTIIIGAIYSLGDLSILTTSFPADSRSRRAVRQRLAKPNIRAQRDPAFEPRWILPRLLDRASGSRLVVGPFSACLPRWAILKGKHYVRR
jgi:hypothetical protein